MQGTRINNPSSSTCGGRSVNVSSSTFRTLAINNQEPEGQQRSEIRYALYKWPLALLSTAEQWSWITMSGMQFLLEASSPFLVAWKIVAETHQWCDRGAAFLRKYMAQAVQAIIVARPNGSGDVSVASATGMLVLVAVDIAACIFRISTKVDLAKRLGRLALVNLVPLSLGGRTSMVVNSILGISLQHHGTLHRWIGRVCSVETSAHLLVQLSVME